MRSETNATHSESREAERSPRECLDKRGEVPRPAVPLALRGKAAVEQPGEQPGEGRRRRAIDVSRNKWGGRSAVGADRVGGAGSGTADLAPKAKARMARASATGRRRHHRLRRGLRAPRKLLWTRNQPPESLQCPWAVPESEARWPEAAGTCGLRFRFVCVRRVQAALGE